MVHNERGGSISQRDRRCYTNAVSTPVKVLVERFRTTLDLHATGVLLQRQRFRRMNPAASPGEVERALVQWLHSRPGAEHGDGPDDQPR